MKLRNKKTGEIGELQITEKHCAVAVGNGTASCGIEIYSSLAELNAEWEDYEEPKDYYFIRSESLTVGYSPISNTRSCRNRKEIGNYFETKEEAEKAVEKLKAWKRLKDKGFKSFSSNIRGDDFVVNFKLTNHVDYSQSMDDFDCVFDFGGEE